MNRRWMLRLAVTGAAALACGCQKPRTIDTTGGAPTAVEPAAELVAQARPPIGDLPVPFGFSLEEGRSRSFAAAGARYIDHVYYGSEDKYAVGRFYKRHMPKSRWTLVTDMFVQGDIVLDYEKESERCRVIVTKGKVFKKTGIKIQLWTSGRIETLAAGGRK